VIRIEEADDPNHIIWYDEKNNKITEIKTENAQWEQIEEELDFRTEEETHI